MLLVTAAGFKKTFYVRRKIDGRSERILIGRFPEWSVEQARGRADEINAISATAKSRRARRARRAEMTLDDLFAHTWPATGPIFDARTSRGTTTDSTSDIGAARKLSTIKHHEVDALHKVLARPRATRRPTSP